MVRGWDGKTTEVGGKVIAVDHRHTVGSHAEACKSLGDEPSLYTITLNDYGSGHTGIEFTPEHPFLTKEGWKSLVPDPNQEPYKSSKEYVHQNQNVLVVFCFVQDAISQRSRFRIRQIVVPD